MSLRSIFGVMRLNRAAQIGQTRRLYLLDLAIQTHPDAAVNYLLRGEYWLSLGEVFQAEDDLLMARRLAEQARDSADWIYLDQAILDRADVMLSRLAQVRNL